MDGSIRVTAIRAKPSRARVTGDGARQQSCGRDCVEFSGATAYRLRVTVRERGSTHVAVLPTQWQRDDTQRARRLLRQTEAAMRQLKSVRQSELVSGGLGSYAQTEYRLQAPNRMAFKTSTGVESGRLARLALAVAQCRGPAPGLLLTRAVT